ncbi:hypothetical protein R1sor_010763 [Riccia sorocarpa]|uniref:Uncharacterized protein n=1 Tax=Riccia sorocarpa TaxID=122646 RepID=A0ABD3I2M7_9MARC
MNPSPPIASGLHTGSVLSEVNKWNVASQPNGGRSVPNPGGTTRPSYAAATNGPTSAHQRRTDPAADYKMGDNERREIAETLNLMPQPTERTDPKKEVSPDVIATAQEEANRAKVAREKELKERSEAAKKGPSSPDRTNPGKGSAGSNPYGVLADMDVDD